MTSLGAGRVVRVRLTELLTVAVVLLPRSGRAQDGDEAPAYREVPAEAAVVVDTAPRSPSSYVFEAAARGAFVSAPIRGAVNPFGVGLGARVGLVLSNVYLGATVVDFFGGTDGVGTDQSLLFGVEAGYSVHLGRHVTLRPQLGLGDLILSHTEPPPAGTVDVVTSASGGGGALSTTTHVANIYLQPGLTWMFAWDSFFVAVDADALIVPGITYGPAPAQETTWLSYTLGGQIGFRL